MPPEIRLKPTRSSIKAYQQLLLGKWDAAMVRSLVDLLERQLDLPKQRIVFPWQNEKNGPVLLRIQERDVEQLAHVLERVHPRLLPNDPLKLKVSTHDRRGNEQLAFRASVLLLVQLLVDVGGESGLFQDTQSLLFLSSAHFLLPLLAATDLPDAHDYLLHAMATHATVMWVDNVAHQQYLLSVLADYLQDEEFEERTLRDSLLLTDPSDHEYLTKLQCLWQFFLDHGRFEKANSILLQSYRTAPKELLPELSEMITETFAEIHAPQSAGRFD